MRRSFAILLWILLGALAASLGIGSVLLHAKEERSALESKLYEEEQRTAALRQEHEQVIAEANRTILSATETASATRALLRTITEEQAALEKAAPLVGSGASKRWPQTISFPLGVSVRTPPNTFSTSTDTLIQSVAASTGGYRSAWLSITRYDTNRFEELTRFLTNTESVQYRLNQTLLTGIKGTMADNATVLILRTQRLGVATHLVWAKITPVTSEDRILDSLSTLLFAADS